MGYFTQQASRQKKRSEAVVPPGNYSAKVTDARTYEKNGSITGLFWTLDIVSQAGTVPVDIALWTSNFHHAKIIEDAIDFCAIDFAAASSPDAALTAMAESVVGCVIEVKIGVHQYAGKTYNNADEAKFVSRGGAESSPQQQALPSQSPQQNDNTESVPGADLPF